ncbi:MAG: class I SAM-dependent methyltransferase [Alphaproteobacteria bacterium]|nr:class I SAM-dependent methyltransferase [Alphaproteobacteria bacterium]
MLDKCPVCAGRQHTPVYRLPKVPIFCNQYWPAEAKAIAAAGGELDIVQCDTCSHVFNAKFDAAAVQYAVGYENSLHFSPTFTGFVDNLAERLVARYELRGKRILEIGCGDGGFLSALCEKGGNKGWGFDPSQTDRRADGANGAAVTITGGFYTETNRIDDVDLICSRHVLEHLEEPVPLLASLRQWHGNGSDTVAYFEVPNGSFVLKPYGIWDLIYEHVSYFTPRSLEYLLSHCGYRIVDMGVAFDDQFLWAEAALDGEPMRPGDTMKPPVPAAAIRDGYGTMVDACQRQIGTFADQGRKMALWGAGSKGVTFLNVADTGKAIETVVDINPRKQELFISLTGQKVVGPEALGEIRPDVIFVMNALYMNEIAATLKSLGVDAELVPVHHLSAG